MQQEQASTCMNPFIYIDGLNVNMRQETVLLHFHEMYTVNCFTENNRTLNFFVQSEPHMEEYFHQGWGEAL